jgi:hypothetical protein
MALADHLDEHICRLSGSAHAGEALLGVDALIGKPKSLGE